MPSLGLSHPWPRVLLVCLAGTLLIGIGKPLWYDEAYTVLAYVVPGPLHALTHYRVPNNHMLYSALLGLLPGGPNEPLYRAVSIAMSLVMLGLVVVVLRSSFPSVAKLGPEAPAALVLTLAAANPAFLSLGTQVRGYALSMLLVAAAARFLLRDGPWDRARYSVTGALALGVLPTNVAPLFALLLFDALRAPGRLRRDSPTFKRLLLSHALVLAGMFFYAPVWSELLANMAHPWGASSRAYVVTTLALTLAPSCLLLMPAAVLARGAAPAPLADRLPGRDTLALGGAMLATVALTLCLPRPWYPRAYAPFLPLAMIVLAAFFGSTLGHRPQLLRILAATTVAIHLAWWHGNTGWLLTGGGQLSGNPMQSIYYEARDFDPAATVALAKEAFDLHLASAVVSDDTDPFAIYYYAVLAGVEGSFHSIESISDGPAWRAAMAPGGFLIASRSEAGRDRLLHFLGDSSAGLRPYKTSGYYRLWLVSAEPRPEGRAPATTFRIPYEHGEGRLSENTSGPLELGARQGGSRQWPVRGDR